MLSSKEHLVKQLEWVKTASNVAIMGYKRKIEMLLEEIKKVEECSIIAEKDLEKLIAEAESKCLETY